MNVLVWNSWVARPVGGMERVALELALRLHERQHRVVLVSAYDNAPELRVRIPSDMPYYPFDIHQRRVKPHLKAARLLWRVTGEHQIEVISGHGSMIAPYEVCRLRGIPLVWTLHGAGDRPQGIIGRLKTAAVGRILAAQTTQVVAVSHATAEILRQQFPRLDEARLHVIHNGIITAEPLAALPLPQPGPPWQLGFIGRLAERKRPLDLIDIAQKLNGSLDFRIHVFGEGPLLATLRAAIQQHRLEQRFVLHGYWDKGSAGMVEQIHLLVHTDSVEPFGGALLESQLGGRPVVAYRVGGNPEIVEHGATGWLVPLADTGALADGVRVVTSEKFAGMSQAARERAARMFSLARMTDEYIALFNQACASP